MSNTTLVIMAAGIGSRFGGGIKQLEPVGPNGEIIMDYSIYDALEAGFDKVVFVIRRSLEKDFKEVIGKRIEKIVKVSYAYQELEDIPEAYKSKLIGREKPWGTGQAILCCKDMVREPFLVINADDYYGKDAFKTAHEYLGRTHQKTDKLQVGMIGFLLGNTLSDNGEVTRGVCEVDDNDMLCKITETQHIVKTNDGAMVAGTEEKMDIGAAVSMNMWLLFPEFFQVLENGFAQFLDMQGEADVKKEYLLPTIVGGLLEKGKLNVKVLKSKEAWFGVTYREDKEAVVVAIADLIERKVYPRQLFES